MAATNKPSLVGWILGAAFTGVPTLVLSILGPGLAGSGDATVARLEAARRGGSKEKLVTGVAQPRAGVEVLTAPASEQPCLAWETSVSVTWPEENSEGRDEWKSNTLRSGGQAVAFEVKNDLGDAIASVDEPRLDLQGQAQARDYETPPPWTDALGGERGADSTHFRRGYRSWELTLMPGATVTVLGVPDATDAKRLRPTPPADRLFVTLGSPQAMRTEAKRLAEAGRWLTRGALVTGVLFVLFAAMLARAVVRRRRAG